MVAEILNSNALTRDFLRRLVADIDEAQMTAQPNGAPNHPAWIIGHLVFSCQAIGGEIGVEPWLPEQWVASFTRGSTPVDERSAYPSKEELLAALDDGTARLRDRLAAMSGEELALPLPDVRFHYRFPTLGHAIAHILAGHTALHAGQLTVWRKVMGLPPVSEL
jgi:hypothetical protein